MPMDCFIHHYFYYSFELGEALFHCDLCEGISGHEFVKDSSPTSLSPLKGQHMSFSWFMYFLFVCYLFIYLFISSPLSSIYLQGEITRLKSGSGAISISLENCNQF